jgi:hypothetical protein
VEKEYSAMALITSLNRILPMVCPWQIALGLGCGFNRCMCVCVCVTLGGFNGTGGKG